MKEMYKGVVNSPETTITNDISNTDTLIYVLDDTRVPDDLPNLMTIGTGTNAETVKVVSKAGSAITVVRGFQGIAKSWPTGSIIARNFTEYDYNALMENINTLREDTDTNEDDINSHKADNMAHGVDTKIPKTLATAANQFLVSSAASNWVVKTIAQVKELLGLGSAAYTESSAYAPSSHISVSASTSAKGHVQLIDSVSSTSTTTAATPNSVKQAYDKANAALPKSGGSMSGELNIQDNLLTRPYIKDYAESHVASTGVSGTKTLDITTGNVFDLTLSGATTLAFSNPAASGRACSMTVIIRMPSTLYAVTYPSSVKWDGDKVPELKAGKVAILTFVTVNGGSRWYGASAGTEFTV